MLGDFCNLSHCHLVLPDGSLTPVTLHVGPAALLLQATDGDVIPESGGVMRCCFRWKRAPSVTTKELKFQDLLGISTLAVFSFAIFCSYFECFVPSIGVLFG